MLLLAIKRTHFPLFPLVILNSMVLAAYIIRIYAMAAAMSLRIKISLLVSLILLLFLLSPGIVQGVGAIGVNKVDLLHKGWRPGTVLVHVNPRKLLKVDATLDYDYAGPNPKHDSRGRRGGNGGKNP